MKFMRTYTGYVETEAQRLLPNCPNVEFERLKKLLKSCPHHVDTAGDSYSSIFGVSSAYGSMTRMSESNEGDGYVGSDSAVEDSGTSVASQEVPDDASVSDFSSSLGSEAMTESNEGNEPVDSTNAAENSTTPAENQDVSSCSKSCPVCDGEFFPDLEKAASAVVMCFNSRAKELLRLRLASGVTKYFVRIRSRIAGNRGSVGEAGNTLVSYGCMNALAIRKILRTYDKVHRSENGQAFKSQLLLKRVELLQSPLLIELGALAINLMDKQAPAAQVKPEGLGHISCSFDEVKQTISCVIPDGVQLDFDLTCSICLELVFDPVALGCGHIFCTSCACAAAHTTIFLGLTQAKRNSKCSVCRQTGVFANSVRMRELFRLITQRCRQYCLERLPAERAQRVREAKEYYERETQIYLRM